jgi:hypothetical protein
MKNNIRVFFIISVILTGSCSKEGCTDPIAFNYNSQASKEDGSCDYEGCTDPNAVNYNPQATISNDCVYDQIGSWQSLSQIVNVNLNMSLFGITLLDTSTTEVVHPDSLDPEGLDFFNDGNMTVHYRNEPSENGTWVRTGDDLSMNLQDTSLIFSIDSINGTFIRLYSSQSESNTDPTTGASINYNYNITWDLSRN